MYRGAVYEAVKVNGSIGKYANNVYSLLKQKKVGNPVYSGFVQDGKNNSLEIETNIIYSNAYKISGYRTEFADEKLDKIVNRVITLYVNYNEHSEENDVYYSYYRDLIHELLHAIDPKSYKENLVNHPKIGIHAYKESSKGEFEYRNQILERQIQLSDRAHRIISESIQKFGYDNTKKAIQNGGILRSLTNTLRNGKNDKEFLKLCYYYYLQNIGKEL